MTLRTFCNAGTAKMLTADAGHYTQTTRMIMTRSNGYEENGIVRNPSEELLFEHYGKILVNTWGCDPNMVNWFRPNVGAHVNQNVFDPNYTVADVHSVKASNLLWNGHHKLERLTSEGRVFCRTRDFEFYTHHAMTGRILITDHRNTIAPRCGCHCSNETGFYAVSYTEMHTWIAHTSNGSQCHQLINHYNEYAADRSYFVRWCGRHILSNRVQRCNETNKYVANMDKGVIVRVRPDCNSETYVTAFTVEELSVVKTSSHVCDTTGYVEVLADGCESGKIVTVDVYLKTCFNNDVVLARAVPPTEIVVVEEPAGTPWWVWLLVVILVILIIVVIGALIYAARQRSMAGLVPPPVVPPPVGPPPLGPPPLGPPPPMCPPICPVNPCGNIYGSPYDSAVSSLAGLSPPSSLPGSVFG